MIKEYNIQGGKVGEISDGYHTFDELYEHRITLYIQLLRTKQQLLYEAGGMHLDENTIWRSRKHSDGSVWDGWFILGINTIPGQQITYHLPESKWDDCKFAEDFEKAPEWDSHTSVDVLERLKSL